jgi:hypothetical protein
VRFELRLDVGVAGDPLGRKARTSSRSAATPSSRDDDAAGWEDGPGGVASAVCAAALLAKDASVRATSVAPRVRFVNNAVFRQRVGCEGTRVESNLMQFAVYWEHAL